MKIKNRIFKISGAVLSAVLLVSCVSSAIKTKKTDGTWEVTGETFSHDPSVIFAEGEYWQFFTGAGIQVRSSKDGNNWIIRPNVWATPAAAPQWWEKNVSGKYLDFNFDVWAPDVVFYNGTYYLYYSVSTFGSTNSVIGVAKSKSIKGPWEDMGMVLKSVLFEKYNCIDPSFVIEAETEKPYLAFGSFGTGIYIVEIDPATMKPADGAPLINIASRDGGAIEGPCLWYNNGYYYLFTSIDRCCQGSKSTYKIRYGRSEKITGPYLDKDGKDMLKDGGTLLMDTEGTKIGPGGQSVLVTDTGSFALVHHYYDKTFAGRATLSIRDFYIDDDGWIAF